MACSRLAAYSARKASRSRKCRCSTPLATPASPVLARAAFDPSGLAVPAPYARLYLVEDGKIKTEQVVFYVSQG